jgi:DNA-binding MarR family transcriptional regulator
MPRGRSRRRPTQRDYDRLAGFRYALRRFLRFSETAALRAGISPAQYQLLLFVRGFRQPPTLTDLAERLQVRHQSAVGLVERCERAGLVRRGRDRSDRRRVRVRLTRRGADLLRRLVAAHGPQFAVLRDTLSHS